MTLLLALALVSPARALEVPYLTSRVNDYARLLSAPARDRLEARLAAHEKATGNQVAVLTLDSLEGEDLEDFSLKVANTWGLGRRGRDDGVLLLISKNDRKMRIEVGRGLEDRLTDGTAGAILREELTPRFRLGDFEGGIGKGIEAVLAALRGEYDGPTSAEKERPSVRAAFEGLPDAGIDLPPWPLRILIGLFVFSILGLFEFVGLFFAGGQGWFLYVFLIPFWAMFPIVIVGPYGAMVVVGLHLVLFPTIKVFLAGTGWGKKLSELAEAKGMRFSSGSSGSSSGFSSSSSGSSSSFSGGGGSFGGGGASGSW